MFHVSRAEKRGGWITVVAKDIMTTQLFETPKYVSFEHVAVHLGSKSDRINAVAVYRPPGPNNKEFVTEFIDLLEVPALTTAYPYAGTLTYTLTKVKISYGR